MGRANNISSSSCGIPVKDWSMSNSLVSTDVSPSFVSSSSSNVSLIVGFLLITTGLIEFFSSFGKTSVFPFFSTLGV